MNRKIFKIGYILLIFMTIFLSHIFASAQVSIETGVEIIPDSLSQQWGSRFTIMSSNTLGPLYRYPAEEKEWLLMENAIAYFRDVLAGAVTYISGATDGETLTADEQRPDGSTIAWPILTFYSSYQGLANCFVSNGQPLQCGSTSITLIWWTTVQCQPPGLWTQNFYNNNNYLFSTQFTLLPQIYPNKVPLYNQLAYNDHYDNVCRITTCSTRDCDEPCGTRTDEIPVTIAQEGCALTDAAMVLSYHGVSVDPPTVNMWLNNYRDARGNPLGYDPKGRIRWNAIAVYARHRGIPIIYNPPHPSDSVWPGFDQLERYICYYGPQIIKMVNRNHWMTGIGRNPERTLYLANDPEGGALTALSSYREMRTFGGQEYTYTDMSGITIRFYSPGELLLTDPQGRRVGYDPINKITYNEIPAAFYETIGFEDTITKEQGPDLKELEVPRPIAGDYQLQVIGTATGTYLLDIMAVGDNGEPYNVAIFKDIPIAPNKIHTYGFYYSKRAGAQLEFKAVEGNFDGKGQRPSDVNKFLSYVTPTQSTTTLPAGTASFSLIIIYDKNIIPSTFQATLNGKDVTSSFHPSTGSAESVTLNLSQGRNTLVLSVEGNLPNRIARDTDRFVFIVP